MKHSDAQKIASNITGINFDHIAHNPFYLMAQFKVLGLMKSIFAKEYEDDIWERISGLLMSSKMKRLQKEFALKYYFNSIKKEYEVGIGAL